MDSKYPSEIFNRDTTMDNRSEFSAELTLRKNCPDTELFLVRIFPHSDWIRKDNEYGYGPEITPYSDTFHAVCRTKILEIKLIQSEIWFVWNIYFFSCFYSDSSLLMPDIIDQNPPCIISYI